MTLAWRRVAVGCAAIAFAGTLSSCKVLPRAESAAGVSSGAVGAAREAPAATGTAACPFAAAQNGSDLGAPWTVASVPSGGCHYVQGARTILISAVPAPRDAKGRSATLALIRKACAAGSTQALAAEPGAFICRQEGLVEAARIVGGRLVVACAAVTADGSNASDIRATLAALVERAA